MAKIVGYDSPNEYDPGYYELLAHGMMGFYAVDIQRFIKGEGKRIGMELEFVPLANLSNQGIEVPRDVMQKAFDVEDDEFIGVIRTKEEQDIHWWVTGREFGQYPDGERELLPSGCYAPTGISFNETLLLGALSKASS